MPDRERPLTTLDTDRKRSKERPHCRGCFSSGGRTGPAIPCRWMPPSPFTSFEVHSGILLSTAAGRGPRAGLRGIGSSTGGDHLTERLQIRLMSGHAVKAVHLLTPSQLHRGCPGNRTGGRPTPPLRCLLESHGAAPAAARREQPPQAFHTAACRSAGPSPLGTSRPRWWTFAVPGLDPRTRAVAYAALESASSRVSVIFGSS